MVLAFLASLAIIIMSIVVHEVSHGFVADALGDPTPRLQGRLTLNPIKHIDPIGSIVVPVASYFLGGTLFGWAKPVMINPYNFAHRKRDELLVALAGPFSNVCIAIGFVLVGHIASYFGNLGDISSSLAESFIGISYTVVITNFVLALFNLVPIPPLDGSKILFAIMPERYDYVRGYLETGGFILIIIMLGFIGPAVSALASYLAVALFTL